LRRLPGISSTIPFGLPFACRQFPLPTSRRLRALAFCTAGGCSADLIGCLVLPAQYSPRYVAAAALSLAADHLRATKKVEIKLPTLYSSFSVHGFAFQVSTVIAQLLPRSWRLGLSGAPATRPLPQVTEQGVLEVTKLMRKIYPEKEGVTNRPAGPVSAFNAPGFPRPPIPFRPINGPLLPVAAGRWLRNEGTKRRGQARSQCGGTRREQRDSSYTRRRCSCQHNQHS